MTWSRPAPSPEEVWRRYDALEARLTAPVSERLLALAGLRPGQRVLDLASGRGEPALLAAQQVGPLGQVVGIELLEPVLRIAREKAAALGLTNLELRVGDAERLEALADGTFDAVTCRWGLMSLPSPVTALTQARAALKPGGVLVAALWAEPERVPFYTLPRQVLRRYRPLPAVNPEAPGTFRYADPRAIERDLEAAGFALEHLEEHQVWVVEADAPAALVEWARALGLTPLLNELPGAQQQAWEVDLTCELEKLRVGGVIRLGGVTRLVCARPAPLRSGP